MDGSWELPDFTDLYGGFSDVYMFENGHEKFLDKNETLDSKRRIKAAFGKQFQGGGSYGSLYKTLKSSQTADERLMVGGIQYHSPGFVEVEGRKELVEKVRERIQDFGRRYEELLMSYKELYRYLHDNPLLSLAADKFDSASDLGRTVGGKGASFCALLGGIKWGEMMLMSDGNQLVATKVLLSLFRRLERLHDFVLQGRARF